MDRIPAQSEAGRTSGARKPFFSGPNPVQAKLNYTLTMEEGINELDNDLLELLFQFAW